jgi:hypothetical protein
VNPYDDAALRAAIDLRDAYDATILLWREQDQLLGRMTWKTVSGYDYLYHVRGDAGHGTSLGRRSADTQARYEQFRTRKTSIKQTLAATEPDLRRAAAVYVALALPVLDSFTAKLLQHLDREQILGSTVMVVGTNAMPAYQLEAQMRLRQRIHATRDVDLAWREAKKPGTALLWPALREHSPGIVINAERPFQAITQDRREIELLVAPSVFDALGGEPFQAMPLPEQEWLLQGEPLRQVVTGLDRTPTALIVPDPRYFALHKAWLADKPGRDPLKRPKDRNQAALVWLWLQESMPRFPLDQAFRDTLSSDQAAIAAGLDASLRSRQAAE